MDILSQLSREVHARASTRGSELLARVFETLKAPECLYAKVYRQLDSTILTGDWEDWQTRFPVPVVKALLNQLYEELPCERCSVCILNNLRYDNTTERVAEHARAFFEFAEYDSGQQ